MDEDTTENPKEMYVTFSIDTKGGINAKTMTLQKNKMKDVEALCIYAVLGETIEQALKRDGRFLDIVTKPGSYLTNKSSDGRVEMDIPVIESQHNQCYRINLKRQQKKNDDAKAEISSPQAGTSKAEARSPCVDNTRVNKSTAKQPSQENQSKKVYKYTPLPDNEEVLQILRDQFEDLKKKMESRNNCKFSEVLSLKRENFGKIRQTFSEVHRVRMLTERANSVCTVNVGGRITGTGFVLFGDLILTCAHLFHGVRSEMELSVDVYVTFNFEEPSGAGSYVVKARNRLLDYHYDADKRKRALDYAILELDPESATPKERFSALPPGVLCRYGEVPDSGEACLIGHPGGEIKQIDPTCIIERKNREEAVNKHRANNLFMIFTINDMLSREDINNLMKGTDRVVTFNSRFYHGSSGSPVFDGYGRVFGLHTAGFVYQHEVTKRDHSVIEYAHPLGDIIKSFVRRLEEDGGQDQKSQKIRDEVEKQLGVLYEQLFNASDDGCEPMDEP